MAKKKTTKKKVTPQPEKVAKARKDIDVTVTVQTPWSEREIKYKMRNVSWGLRHKENRWPLAIMRGLQSEFGNSVKQE